MLSVQLQRGLISSSWRCVVLFCMHTNILPLHMMTMNLTHFLQCTTSCHSWALPASVAIRLKRIINQASIKECVQQVAVYTAGYIVIDCPNSRTPTTVSQQTGSMKAVSCTLPAGLLLCLAWLTARELTSLVHDCREQTQTCPLLQKSKRQKSSAAKMLSLS